jgi:hypothetical protein
MLNHHFTHLEIKEIVLVWFPASLIFIAQMANLVATKMHRDETLKVLKELVRQIRHDKHLPENHIKGGHNDNL